MQPTTYSGQKDKLWYTRPIQKAEHELKAFGLRIRKTE